VSRERFSPFQDSIRAAVDYRCQAAPDQSTHPAVRSRYARKLPIAQHRFRQTDRDLVSFATKDTRTKRLVETFGTTSTFETSPTLQGHFTPTNFSLRSADGWFR
jgi:hypothetical protein